MKGSRGERVLGGRVLGLWGILKRGELSWKAESKDGDKLFTSAEDRLDVMGEETTVVSGIANEMFGTIEAFEDVEKN